MADAATGLRHPGGVPYPDKLLTEDEEVVRHLHPHWTTVFWPVVRLLLIVGVASFGTAMIPMRRQQGVLRLLVLAAALVLLLILVVVPLLRWRTTHYVISTHRVLFREGMLTRHGRDLGLSRITDVSYRQTLWERIINSGTLTIESAGDGGATVLEAIPDSDGVQQLLNHMIEEDADRRAQESAGYIHDYLTFPVLALLVRPLRRLHPVLLLALACAAMWPLFDISYGGVPTIGLNWMVRITCCCVAGMLACLSARGMQRRERAEQWGLILSVTSLVCILLLSCWAAWRTTLSTGDFAGVVTVTYPALIVGLALSDRGPARVLSTAPLVYGGRISYCLYLVHFMVMDVVVTCYWQDEARRGQVTPALALAVPLIALASFALAAALHHGVEEAARLRMLAWLSRRTGARETAPAATRVPAAAAASAPRPI